MSTLQAKFWGTRGSIPVAGKSHARFGGNTTCVEIVSDCLPSGYRLVIDAGTGIIPFGQALLTNGATRHLILLQTHYHHDHTQGLLMLPQLYDKSIGIQILGPEENGVGPKEVIETLMRPPLFPVAYAEISSHVRCKGMEHPAGKIIVLHHDNQPTLITLEELERVDQDPSQQLRLGQRRVNINECLVVRMHRSNHPERTISYRFEDRASGKVFVLLTDHENTDGIPAALRRHLFEADVLAMDAQYTRKQYTAFTAGFGHGTPDYCLSVARSVSAKKLYLTHHDPGRDDDDIEQMLQDLESDNESERQDHVPVHMVADGDVIEL